ncbi:MAG: hypothetical protein PHW52_01245 [Candidatus Pacebacteria bacterium]|nr:hypothetical protein [Candidatus Paceibacterota bacterium]
MKSFSDIEDNQASSTQDNIKLIVYQQFDYLDGVAKTISLNGQLNDFDVKNISELNIDYLSLVSLDNKIEYNKGYDLEKAQESSLSEALVNRLVTNYATLKSKAGLTYDNNESLAIGIARGSNGYVVVGKRISKKIPNSFSMGHYFTIEKINSPLLMENKYIKEGFIDKSNQDYIYSYFFYDNIFGDKEFYSKSIISRDIYKIGLSQLEIIFYILFLTQILTIIVFLYSIKKLITNRLEILIDSIQVKRKKNNNPMPVFTGNDEISILSQETSKSFDKIERAKKEAEYKQLQLDSVLVSMHDSVFIFDRTNKLISSFVFNDKKDGKIVSHKLNKDILPNDVFNKIIRAINQVRDGDNLINITYSITKNKNKFWYDANISEKKNKSGEFDGAIVVARDITRSRNMEEGIKEKLSELEDLNKLMVGRELKMIELKERIKELEKKKWKK